MELLRTIAAYDFTKWSPEIKSDSLQILLKHKYLLTYEIVIDIPHPLSKFRSSEYIFGELCCFYWFTEWIFYLPTITSGFPPRWSAWVLIKSPTKEPLFASAGQSKQKSFSSWKGNGKQKHSYKSMENAFKMVSLFVISHQSISLVLIGCTV